MSSLEKDDVLQTVIEINAHGDPTGMFESAPYLDKKNAKAIGAALGAQLTSDGIIILTGCNVGLQKDASFAQSLANASGTWIYASMSYTSGNFLLDGQVDVGPKIIWSFLGLNKAISVEDSKSNGLFDGVPTFAGQKDIYRIFRPE